MFFSLKPDGSLDEMTKHASCAVLKGTKWTSTVWVHTKPWRCELALFDFPMHRSFQFSGECSVPCCVHILIGRTNNIDIDIGVLMCEKFVWVNQLKLYRKSLNWLQEMH